MLQYDLKQSLEGIDTIAVPNQKKKVLVYALTGDVSDNAVQRIMKGNFDHILGSLDFSTVQSILEEIIA
jgi:hypothetical protein